MCQMCDELAQEKMQVRRISANEVHAEVDVFAARVQERINELLEKYGCEQRIMSFAWDGNGVLADVMVVRKPVEQLVDTTGA